MVRRLTLTSLLVALAVIGSAGMTKLAAQGREGIKVHGHWAIDIRNPDGALVSHHEFENSLITGFNGQTNGPSGATLLSAWLSRRTQPGPWQIYLWSPGGTGIAGGPGPGQTLQPICHDSVLLSNPCVIFEPDRVRPFGTLNILHSPFEGVLLGGTATADSNGSIGAVQTLNTTPLCLTSNGLAYVPEAGCQPQPVDVLFSGTVLPTPINVVHDQIIQVTVTLSFS
jgi:hypothetical protein